MMYTKGIEIQLVVGKFLAYSIYRVFTISFMYIPQLRFVFGEKGHSHLETTLNSVLWGETWTSSHISRKS
jgi:hypothetical protein